MGGLYEQYIVKHKVMILTPLGAGCRKHAQHYSRGLENICGIAVEMREVNGSCALSMSMQGQDSFPWNNLLYCPTNVLLNRGKNQSPRIAITTPKTPSVIFFLVNPAGR